MPKLVIDLDDTIACKQNGQDFLSSKPNADVIAKVNKLHDELGFEVVVHTSRGMVSCDGDYSAIIDKYYGKVKWWLDENGVHYDDIIFMKPLADLYVDDKAMGVKEFVDSDIRYLGGGGSGSSILRVGKYVKKSFKDYGERLAYQEWCSFNKDLGVFNVPDDISYSYDSVVMEFAEGTQLCHLNAAKAKSYVACLVEACMTESAHYYGFDFDVSKQLDVLMKNRHCGGGTEFDSIITNTALEIANRSGVLAERYSSFCHGDLTAGNVICNGSDIKVIDPRYIEGSSSYLLDLAKLKMSLMGYERMFFDGEDLSSLVYIVDDAAYYFGAQELVDLFTLMFILRLFRYKDYEGKKKVVKWAKEAYDALSPSRH